MARRAHAQMPGREETDIAPLADVISSISDVEIMQMEQAVTDIVSLTPSEVCCYAFPPIGRAEQVEQKKAKRPEGMTFHGSSIVDHKV